MFDVVIACINHGFLYIEKRHKSHVTFSLINGLQHIHENSFIFNAQ
jgi:hypothetical protein